MQQCVKTGAVIRWARQEELVALGCHQPLTRWVPLPGHPLGTSGTSCGSRGCVRGASHPASAAPCWGGWLSRIWPWQRRALRFALVAYPGPAAQPRVSLAAAAQTERGRRKCPCSASEPWEALLVYPWSRVWAQLQHWIGLAFILAPVCKLQYCLFKIPYKHHVIC